MKTLKKEINLLELLISILSLLVGAFMIYWAVYFIYTYHFTNALWFEMQSMTTLVIKLVLGLTLVASACSIFRTKNVRGSLFRFTGILIMLCPINFIILYILDDYWHIQILLYLILSSIGLFLYLFFKQHVYIHNRRQYCIELLGVGIGIYFLIDVIFYNWTYF